MSERHIYLGNCPMPEYPWARDALCPACDALGSPCPDCLRPVGPLHRYQHVEGDGIVRGLCQACYDRRVTRRLAKVPQ